jgi:hypothetical protein
MQKKEKHVKQQVVMRNIRITYVSPILANHKAVKPLTLTDREDYKAPQDSFKPLAESILQKTERDW